MRRWSTAESPRICAVSSTAFSRPVHSHRPVFRSAQRSVGSCGAAGCSSACRSFASASFRHGVYEVQNDKELRSLIDDSPEDALVVVDWTASWCGPCRAIAPVYDALSLQDDNSSVTFIRADVDMLPDASAEAEVQSVPTFHFIRGNKLVDQVVGADEQRLRDTIAKHR